MGRVAVLLAILMLTACSDDTASRTADRLSRDFSAVASTIDAAAASPQAMSDLRTQWRQLGLDAQLDSLAQGVGAMPDAGKSRDAKASFNQAVDVLREISAAIPAACKATASAPGDLTRNLLSCNASTAPTQLVLQNSVARARAAWNNGLAILK